MNVRLEASTLQDEEEKPKGYAIIEDAGFVAKYEVNI